MRTQKEYIPKCYVGTAFGLGAVLHFHERVALQNIIWWYLRFKKQGKVMLIASNQMMSCLLLSHKMFILTGERTCPAKARYSSCVLMVRFVLNCFCIILMIPFIFVIVELAGGETGIKLFFILNDVSFKVFNE